VERSPEALADLEETLGAVGLDEETSQDYGPIHAATLFYGGRGADAYELIRRIRPAVPLSTPGEELALALWTMISMESGQDLAEVERAVAETFDARVRAGDRVAAAIGALTLGGLALLAGRYRDAQRWVAEAELHFEHRDAFGNLVIARSAQVSIAAVTEGRVSLDTALERFREALGDREPLPTELPYIVRAQAAAAVARGDRRAAQGLLRETAQQLSEMPIYAAALEYEAMRAGAPARPIAVALAELRARCDARLVAAYADHAAALAGRDGRGLLESADEFERIGTLRYGTEAAAQAAEVFLNAGRQDSARRAAAGSRELFVGGQGMVMPVIEGLDRDAVGLTRREAQLVELARQGLTNPEIAERLVLSVRTVESHLYRAMQKLGISDRRDL